MVNLSSPNDLGGSRAPRAGVLEHVACLESAEDVYDLKGAPECTESHNATLADAPLYRDAHLDELTIYR